MPGLVMINGDTAPGNSEPKPSNGEGPQVEVSAGASQVETGPANGDAVVNGQRSLHESNGRDDGPSQDIADGSGAVMESSHADEEPPEIEHITVGYQPLSKLITRLAQDTFNNLREVIDAMAEMSVSPTPNGHNPPKLLNSHVTVNGDDENSTNIQKKMRLMNFAQDRRAQFIKALVLTQWSRQSEDVSKVIDLKVWLDRQRYLYDEAWYWLGDLKRSLEPAKLPNPDLRTAVEVLSTGKASWLPKLGYIPPTPLTPQEMLKTLRNINVLLTIRLNLHDTLPHQFKSFTVASGRVTFRVPGEFEVDLSIADEDPSSQFFFIDLRFLFSPSSAELPASRVTDEIEGKINYVLRTEGLKGCYHFLHEFVLTHKIHILRRQAYMMARNRWHDSIRLESVRRTLVVQYWPNKAGRKSWIEIGISSGRGKDARRGKAEQDPSRITVRWFPDGKQVVDPSILLNLDHLSMETTLKHVIALHTTRILSSIRHKLLETKVYADRTLSLRQKKSSEEPSACLLKMQLTPSTTATLKIEPVTGRYALLPGSALFLRAELELNSMKQPASDGHISLFNLRCFAAMDEVESRARCVGWMPWKALSPKTEDIKRVFPRQTLRVSYFRRNGWRKDWIVAISIGTSGEDWWIIELLEAPIGYTFGDYERIPTKSGKSRALDPTYTFLSHLGKVAGGMISNYVNVRTLSRTGVKHALQKDSSPAEHGVHLPALLINFSSLMPQSSSRYWKPWVKELLRVRCQSVSLAYGQITLVIEARLMGSMPQAELIKDRVEDDIVFHPPTGAFAFRLITAVGEPMIDKLRERLKRIERLMSFLNVVGKFNLVCETISLNRIVFTYSSEHGYKADVGFAGDSPMTLAFAPGNPHLRIRDFLTKLLNSDSTRSSVSGGGGLEHLALILGITLPLMLVLDELERVRPDDGLFVLPRAADWYQIRYERPRCTLDIRLRQRRDEVKWFVRENASFHHHQQQQQQQLQQQEQTSSNKGTRDAAGLVESLQALMNDRGEGWIGLRTGIATDVYAIADVLRRINRIMRDHVAGADDQNSSGNGNGSGV